jgi:hypothetical protein
MEIIVSVLGTTGAAFSIWLVVRIVNRKERWAKWTLAIVLTAFVAYPLSSGPADWLLFHGYTSEPANKVLRAFYAPSGWVIRNSPKPVQDAYLKYDAFCANFGDPPEVAVRVKKRAAKPPVPTPDSPSESN